MSKQAYYFLAVAIIAIGAVSAFTHFRTPAATAPTTTTEATAVPPTPTDVGHVSGATTDDLLTDGVYGISLTDSTVNWEGRKNLIANYKDTGTLGIKEGTFTVADKKVSTGAVTFDMTTITPTVIFKVGGEDMLAKHLKSDSFFSVDKFPTTTFTIKDVTADATVAGQFTINGDLTIKGISHAVSFPATTTAKDGALIIDAKTDLDRTLWDIRFGSSKFFDNLANNVIDDNFTVTLHIVAKPVTV